LKRVEEFLYTFQNFPPIHFESVCFREILYNEKGNTIIQVEGLTFGLCPSFLQESLKQ